MNRPIDGIQALDTKEADEHCAVFHCSHKNDKIAEHLQKFDGGLKKLLSIKHVNDCLKMGMLTKP